MNKNRALHDTAEYSMQLSQNRKIAYNDINNTGLVFFSQAPYFTSKNRLKTSDPRDIAYKTKFLSVPIVSQNSLRLNRQTYKKYLKSQQNPNPNDIGINQSFISSTGRSRRSAAIKAIKQVRIESSDSENEEEEDSETEETETSDSSRYTQSNQKKCSFCSPDINATGNANLTCLKCGRNAHPECLSFNDHMTEMVQMYDWTCVDCKICSICNKMDTANPDEAEILLCDSCDRGYHFGCIHPKLEKLPDGEWYCVMCSNAM